MMNLRARADVYGITGNKGLTAAANALVLVVAAHKLPAESFGIFSAMLGASVLTGRLLLLGCEYGYARLRTTAEWRDRERQLAGAGITVIGLGSAVLLLAALAAQAFWPVWSAAVVAAWVMASIGWACTELSYWLYLVHGRTWRAVLVQTGTVSARALAVFAAALWIRPADVTIPLAYGITGVALGCWSSRGAWFRYAEPAPLAVVRQLLRYSGWQGFSQALMTLSAWFGAFALLWAGEPAASGQFSLAMTLTSGVLILTHGFGEYATLRAVALPGVRALGGFLREAVAQTALVALACVALLSVIGWIGPYLFPAAVWADGSAYVPLALAAVLSVAHVPLEAASHFLVKPWFVFASKFLRLGVLVAVGPAFAVQGGAAAVAWVQAGATLAGWIYLAVAVLYERKAQARLADG